MLADLTVPYFLDDRPVFQIDYDEDEGVFDAYVCSRNQRQWVWLRSSGDFDELYRRCTTQGIAYEGATEDALYRATFGLRLS